VVGEVFVFPFQQQLAVTSSVEKVIFRHVRIPFSVPHSCTSTSITITLKHISYTSLIHHYLNLSYNAHHTITNQFCTTLLQQLYFLYYSYLLISYYNYNYTTLLLLRKVKILCSTAVNSLSPCRPRAPRVARVRKEIAFFVHRLVALWAATRLPSVFEGVLVL
jgi:hypothetical protein